MLNRPYLRRLERDLTDWIARGWVAAGHRDAILAHAAQSGAAAGRAPLAFAALGVTAFGAGIILFFAANWQEMSRAMKLAVLFGAMWAAYAAAYFAQARPGVVVHRFAPALLLLGLILFGANINLIAQIYHISGHYPNAILLWAAGALALTYLAPTQAVAVVGLLLLLLWSGMETFEFYWRVHWPFVIALAAFVPAIIHRSWRVALRVALFVLLGWGAFVFYSWLDHVSEKQWDASYLLSLYLLAGAALFAVGARMAMTARVASLAVEVTRYGLMLGLFAFYALTIRYVLGMEDGLVRAPAGAGWIAAILAGVATAAGLGLWALRRAGAIGRDWVMRTGLAVLVAVMLLIVANLFVPDAEAPLMALYIGFNLAFYATLVWLIYSGYVAGDAFRVNIGFGFFAMGGLTLYFDLLWTLTSRSFFFMGTGLVLFAGGWLLERERRRLVRGMGAAEAGQ